MRISVVIPAFNEERLLPRCVAAVARAAVAFRDRGWDMEVVVCDNNSSDRTAELARAAGARVVFEPVNQIARARNTGAADATGDWLVFIDGDSFPEAPLFGAIAEAVESGKVAGGGALVRMDGVAGPSRFLVEIWNLISRCARWAAGSCVFCEARLFRELGGFSEALYASEEIDFSRRLKRAARASGRRVVIVTRHRLASSGRKLHLCSPIEYLRLLGATVFTGGTNLQRREGLGIWYDGRR